MKKMLLIIAMALFTISGMAVKADNSAVSELSLDKYLGKWYEIAKFDHWFEQGVSFATATYTLKQDGTLSITNKGIKKGKWKSAKGRARITGEPGVLKVSFFGPFYSEYRVLWVSDDYQSALVGSKDDDKLWILSRTPEIQRSVLVSILDNAHERGYYIDDLLWVNQGRPLPDINLEDWYL